MDKSKVAHFFGLPCITGIEINKIAMLKKFCNLFA